MFLLSIILWSLTLLCLPVLVYSFDRIKYGNAPLITMSLITLFLLGSSIYVQTRTIVPAQTVGITRDRLSQNVNGELNSGIQGKPFFGATYVFPNAESTEYCTQYTPSLKGSYGVTLDVCYYIDTASVNWLTEVQRTGSFDSTAIWNVWRNSVVSDVAEAIKEYTPEQVSANRALVEGRIYENVLPWFNARGVPLERVSLVDWDFTSETVAATFDESIASQRRITEQTALLEAAKLSRERQMYEAETAAIVADAQQQMLTDLGFTGQDAINYLWITLYKEQETTPEMVIVPSGANLAVSP